MISFLRRSIMLATVFAMVVVTLPHSTMAQTIVVDAQDLPTSAGVGEANAIFDLATGELTLQFGQGLQVFGLTGIPFDNEAAVPGLLAIDPISPQGFRALGPGTVNDAYGISVIDTGFLPTGEFNLGAILLPDFRTEAALADLLFRFDSAGNNNPQNAINASNNVFLTNVPIAEVPEPSSLSLLVLAGLGVVASCRR